MKTTRALQRANALSNQLYRGEIDRPEVAFRALRDGMEAQIEDTKHYNAQLGPDEQEWVERTDAYKRSRDQATQALAIWEEEQTAALKRALKRAVERIRQMPDCDYIADAIESGHYDGLAW